MRWIVCFTYGIDQNFHSYGSVKELNEDMATYRAMAYGDKAKYVEHIIFCVKEDKNEKWSIFPPVEDSI